jgi:hypothetical protein
MRGARDLKRLHSVCESGERLQSRAGNFRPAFGVSKHERFAIAGGSLYGGGLKFRTRLSVPEPGHDYQHTASQDTSTHTC